MKVARLTPVFVEFIPEVLEDGKLYVSLTYQTTQHKCCCGCGQRVVAPLSKTPAPNRWTIAVNGEFVTLSPSIGNWSFPCRSHYFIRRNKVQWSYDMSQEEIDAGREYDASLKEGYSRTSETKDDSDKEVAVPTKGKTRAGPLQRLMKWLFGR